MTNEQYAADRAYLLYQCRGYWDGTTCTDKVAYQRTLVLLRYARNQKGK